jgi:hypothetical protein
MKIFTPLSFVRNIGLQPIFICSFCKVVLSLKKNRCMIIHVRNLMMVSMPSGRSGPETVPGKYGSVPAILHFKIGNDTNNPTIANAIPLPLQYHSIRTSRARTTGLMANEAPTASSFYE